MIDRRMRSVVIVLLALSLVMALAELGYEKHPHVSYEHWFSFHGFWALLVSVVMMAVAPVARMVLERQEDYYDG